MRSFRIFQRTMPSSSVLSVSLPSFHATIADLLRGLAAGVENDRRDVEVDARLCVLLEELSDDLLRNLDGAEDVDVAGHERILDFGFEDGQLEPAALIGAERGSDDRQRLVVIGPVDDAGIVRVLRRSVIVVGKDPLPGVFKPQIGVERLARQIDRVGRSGLDVEGIRLEVRVFEESIASILERDLVFLLEDDLAAGRLHQRLLADLAAPVLAGGETIPGEPEGVDRHVHVFGDGSAADATMDADDLAVEIEQRPARVAADERAIAADHGRIGVEDPTEANDRRAVGPEAAGMADGDDPLPLLERARLAHLGERILPLVDDLDQAAVDAAVAAQRLGLQQLAVGHDEDAVDPRFRGDVARGEDVAVFADDDAAPLGRPHADADSGGFRLVEHLLDACFEGPQLGDVGRRVGEGGRDLLEVLLLFRSRIGLGIAGERGREKGGEEDREGAETKRRAGNQHETASKIARTDGGSIHRTISPKGTQRFPQGGGDSHFSRAFAADGEPSGVSRRFVSGKPATYAARLAVLIAAAPAKLP